MRIRQAWVQLCDELQSHDIQSRLEAAVLFETALGFGHAGSDPEVYLSEEQLQTLWQLLQRRLSGEPLQYIAGSWPFMDMELSVGKGVLIPRDETVLLAQKAIYLASQFTAPVVLDLCSGSGCLALAIARALPEAQVTAVESQREAYAYLTANISQWCKRVRTEPDDVRIYHNSLVAGSVDLIVCNPPYLTPQEYREAQTELHHEPPEAFLGGSDGLDFYRAIIPDYRDSLCAGGWMLFETGSRQAGAVIELFEQNSFTNIAVYRDMQELDRVVAAMRGEK